MIEPKLHAAIDALRAELRQRHGATHLEVQLRVDPQAQRVVVEGEVLVHRIAALIEARLCAELPSGWFVDTEAVRPSSGGGWRAVTDRVALHARRGTDVPCTVLLPEDGPVQELARADDEQLVRGIDGTVGWLDGSLGDEIDAPRLEAPRDVPVGSAIAIASQYLGVAYRLGGTDEHAIDCSGLVQRVLRRSHGIVVPRHSTDQRAIDPRRGEPPQGEGHLAFVWTRGEALCHVGIATDTTVIHASLSRGRVIEEPREAFVSAATRVEHVTFDALLAFARRVAGQPSLIAAGFVLGRPVA
jgi:cell wall-associated NlpC family hydrolase